MGCPRPVQGPRPRGVQRAEAAGGCAKSYSAMGYSLEVVSRGNRFGVPAAVRLSP